MAHFSVSAPRQKSLPHPTSDGLRGGRGCQVFNNSSREAILHSTQTGSCRLLSLVSARL